MLSWAKLASKKEGERESAREIASLSLSDYKVQLQLYFLLASFWLK